MHEITVTGVDEASMQALMDALTDVDGATRMNEEYNYSYDLDSDGYINKITITN